MKTPIVLTCIICLCSALTTHGQGSADPRENLTAGVKAGVNVSNVWDEKGDDFTADARIGFAGGVFFGIPMGKYLGFQPEALISQKGFQGSGRYLLTSYSFSRTTTYLDIPLQLQIKPVQFLTILAGPQYSYLVRQNDVYTFGTNSIGEEQNFETNNIRKNSLGAIIGVDGYISHLVISGRMGWDLQANNGNGTSYDPRYKNRWVQLTIGLKI